MEFYGYLPEIGRQSSCEIMNLVAIVDLALSVVTGVRPRLATASMSAANKRPSS